MTHQHAKAPPAPESAAPRRKESGVQRLEPASTEISTEHARALSVPEVVDQDLVATLPENDAPRQDRETIIAPPPVEEARDTLPAPPPDEHD